MTPSPKSTKLVLCAKTLNIILILILLGAVAGFLSFMNPYGIFLAGVTGLIAWGIVNHNRWAYFGAAVWGLGCYQLAKQGYEFQAIKPYVMALGISVVPVALFLHEMLTKPAIKNAQNSGSNDPDKKNMPK